MQGRDERDRGGLLVWTIYALYDPRQPLVYRYVGRTTQDPRRRLYNHISDAKVGRDQTHCGNWKRALLRDGVRPALVILESGTGEGWQAAEVRWIAFFREHGGLTNHTDGGDGTFGWKWPPERIRPMSDETKAKIGLANKGRKHTEASRAAMSAAHKGYKHTPEQTAKIAAANRGRHQSEEERAKRRRPRDPQVVEQTAAKLRGRHRSPEVREKMRQAHLGKPLSRAHAQRSAEGRRGLKRSDEVKARISAAIKAWHAKRRQNKAP